MEAYFIYKKLNIIITDISSYRFYTIKIHNSKWKHRLRNKANPLKIAISYIFIQQACLLFDWEYVNISLKDWFYNLINCFQNEFFEHDNCLMILKHNKQIKATYF